MINMSMENVVVMNPITQRIYMFLGIKGRKSKNTAKTYKTGIEQFFQKPIDRINVHDINKVDLEMIDTFINYQVETGKYNNKTINSRIIAIKELFKDLHKIYQKGSTRIVDDISFLNDVEMLPETENFHGDIGPEEVVEMANWARDNERMMGDIKYHLIRFSLQTCARINECLKLKWSDFQNPDAFNEVQMHIIGKGKKDFYPKITLKQYKSLVDDLKQKYNSEFVFPISRQSISDMMQRYKKAFSIPKERNISFHSIRGCAITSIYELNNNDLMVAAHAANHSNLNTLRHYLNVRTSRANGYLSTCENTDMDMINKVSKEELVNAIKQLSKTTQLEINHNLQKVVKNN